MYMMWYPIASYNISIKHTFSTTMNIWHEIYCTSIMQKNQAHMVTNLREDHQKLPTADRNAHS